MAVQITRLRTRCITVPSQRSWEAAHGLRSARKEVRPPTRHQRLRDTMERHAAVVESRPQRILRFQCTNRRRRAEPDPPVAESCLADLGNRVAQGHQHRESGVDLLGPEVDVQARTRRCLCVSKVHVMDCAKPGRVVRNEAFSTKTNVLIANGYLFAVCNVLRAVAA